MRKVHFKHNTLTRNQVKQAGRKLLKVIIGGKLDGTLPGDTINKHIGDIIREELLISGNVKLTVEPLESFKKRLGF